jgi:hypothetical protein
LFGADLPANAPWDPIPAPRSAAGAGPSVGQTDGSTRAPAAITTEARTLQGSALRRIWSTLMDRRDWVSYIYVPIIVPILVLLPYVAYTGYQRSHRLNQLVRSFAQGTKDLETLSDMLEDKPVAWPAQYAERVRTLDEPDFKGYEILQDSRILDLRAWQPGQPEKDAPNSLARVYRRLKVVKQAESTGNNLKVVKQAESMGNNLKVVKQAESKDKNLLRLHLLPTSPRTLVHFPPQQLQPRLRRCDLESSVPGQEEWRFEATFDFQGVPVGEYVDLMVEELSPGQYLARGPNGSALSFLIQGETAELTTWILMPKGREYLDFRISRHETGKSDKAETVRLVTEYLADDFTILAFKLLALKPGWTYMVTWHYK